MEASVVNFALFFGWTGIWHSATPLELPCNIPHYFAHSEEYAKCVGLCPRPESLVVGLFLQNTRNEITIATMARAKEMPSTQRTTPVVSPCRALVAVSIWGCRSDMRNANVTANAKFPGQERQINNFTGCSSAEVHPTA